MATTCKLIAKVVLGSSASSIQFASIPGTYDDLLCLLTGRAAGAVTNRDFNLQFNSSASNRTIRRLRGNGSTASSDTYSSLEVGVVPGASATSNTFGNTEIYVPNYAGSTNKSLSSTSTAENNATSAIVMATAGLWSDTAAITSIDLIPNGSDSFVAGSTAYLYGITKS